MIVQIWIIALIIKISLLPYLPITPDETYYFAWGRHLQLSYFDHPPFVSWLMWIGGFFWKTPFGARLPGVIFEHVGILPWMALLKRTGFSNKMLVLWILAILVGPMTGLGGFIITPDVPLIFFWGLSLLVFHHAVEKPTGNMWLLLGVTFGFGLLSKYTMILFLPAMLLWICLEKKNYLLKKRGPWIGLALGFVIFLPVVIWNYQNHFASFKFQTLHGLSSSGFIHFKWPLEYILGQIGLLNPFLAGLAIIGCVKYYRTQKLLIIFGLFPVAFFLLTSFRARVEPNWPVCAYPALTAMAVLAASLKERSERNSYLTIYKTGVLISAMFFVVIVSHAIKPWLPISRDMDRTTILREWQGDILILKKYSPLYGRSYQISAYHSYFRDADKEVIKPSGMDRKDFYDFLDQPTTLAGGYIVLDAQDIIYDRLQKKYSLNVIQSLPSGLVLFGVRDQ